MRQRLLGIVSALIFAATATPTDAQVGLPPEEGGEVISIGQPPLWKPYGGGTLGSYYPGDASDVTIYADLGVDKDLMNPVVGGLVLGGEAYGGMQGSRIDGGLRALLHIPFLRLGGGVDWNFRDGDLPFFLRFAGPVRRGGLMGRGGLLTIDWIPARGHSFNIGVKLPINQPWRGKTRPERTSVKMQQVRPVPLPLDDPDPALVEALENVEETGWWINELVTPGIDQRGRTREQATANFTADIREIRDRLQSPDPLFGGRHTAEAEVRAFHAEIARAFSIAASGDPIPFGTSTPLGEEIAAQAREIVLERVLFPYNRLLGIKKEHDSTREFSARAAGAFSRWAIHSGLVPEERLAAVRYVFQRLLEGVEEVRAYNKQVWHDERLVWLPLQFGLLPEEHDSNPELDAIIERAVGREFMDGNGVWYIINAQFQFELAHALERAEDYHVLWIHDIRGITGSGDPDRVSLFHVNLYIKTLTKRVREYDQTGKLPTYMIFMDQHYYEINKARRWISYLEDPMHYEFDFPSGYEWMADTLSANQAALREAVAESRLMQAEARQYGQDWLRKRIKVHASITNPADPTYWASEPFPVVSWPDNVMRDHRKISFYDITEDDPYRGRAMYSGMGIGEHYMGPTWEDRAILLQGPAALDMKNAARELLLNQGFKPDEIPVPLQEQPLAEDYWDRVAEFMHDYMDGARAMELHNETGYLPKPINVARAVLFTLAPPGTVMILPDSLWHAPLWASMLVGTCLRGGRVLIIHPSQRNAPGQAFMTLSRANELFERLIIIQHELAGEIAAVNGQLRTGLYDTDIDVANIPERLRAAAEGLRVPWLRETFEIPEDWEPIFANPEEIFPDFDLEYVIEDSEVRRPKLHMKTNLIVSAGILQTLEQSPEWPPFLMEYMQQRVLDVQSERSPAEYRDVEELNRAVRQDFWKLVESTRELATEEQRETAVFYHLVGSSNMDYRSMLMDGEVGLLVSGKAAIHGLLDALMLAGAARWIDDVEVLNQYLPRYEGFEWKTSRWIKNML
ncbi:hypothetical protein ACFL5T_00835 [Gemmatimonadota bacterium]